PRVYGARMPARELSGPRVRAREWRAGDADEVWRLVQDQPNIFGRVGFIASCEDAERWVAQEVADKAASTRIKYRFALELIEDGTLIGGSRVHFEDASNKMDSIGMALNRPYWGRGYGTEVGMLMLQMSFEQLDVHRIEALVEPSNERSVALVRQAGC